MIGGAFWPHSEKVITIGCQPVSWGSSPHVVASAFGPDRYQTVTLYVLTILFPRL